MSSRRAGGVLLALVLSLLAVAVSPVALSPAQAVTGSPPVTTPDSFIVFPGSFSTVKPTKNDVDPDGDRLAVCRLGDEHYRGIEVVAVGTDIAILTKPSVKPGV